MAKINKEISESYTFQPIIKNENTKNLIENNDIIQSNRNFLQRQNIYEKIKKGNMIENSKNFEKENLSFQPEINKISQFLIAKSQSEKFNESNDKKINRLVYEVNN